jgi:hypothetical protein
LTSRPTNVNDDASSAAISRFGNLMTSTSITSQNLMKRKMEAGELAVGMIVRLMRNVEIAAIARSAGFDSLYIDLEH